jgi:hypothetical protein
MPIHPAVKATVIAPVVVTKATVVRLQRPPNLPQCVTDRERWNAVAKLAYRIFIVTLGITVGVVLHEYEISTTYTLALDRIPDFIQHIGEYKEKIQ